MKKVVTMLVLAVLVCSNHNLFSQQNTTIDCSKIPAISTPPLAVNDIANIIDEVSQSELENKLQSYWNTDSIALCVVTVKTLNDYDQFDYSMSIARCWGIGGKDNRGVLLFIAFDEHKISIRTGSGLEPYITDAKSGQIIREMGPSFKEGNYAEGIKYAVSEILLICNDIPSTEKTEASKRRQAAIDKQNQETWDAAMDVLALIGFLALLGFIIYQIHKGVQRRKVRKQVKLFIQKVNVEIASGNTKVKEATTGLDKAASWVRKEVSEYVKQCEYTLEDAKKLLKHSEAELKTDPMQAERLALESLELVKKAFQGFLKFHEGLRTKVKNFRMECPKRISIAQEVVSKNIQQISDYIKEGYRLDSFLNEQNDFQRLLQDYQDKISDEELHPKMYTDSELIQSKSRSVINQVEEIIKNKSLIDKELPGVVERATKLYQEFEGIKNILSLFKEKYPRSVWEQLDVKIKKVPVKLSSDVISEFASDVKQLNSMEKQKFQSASLKFTTFDNFLADTFQVYEEVKSVILRQEESQKEYPGYVLNVEKSVSQAADVAKDTDVSTETRTAIKNLAQKLRDVKIDAKKSIVDWVGILLLLALIQKDADSANKKAKREISDAEESRKRKAREAAEKKARDNDYYHSTPSVFSNYSSSDNDSTSSFGGFGGGSFSGGGADGGW